MLLKMKDYTFWLSAQAFEIIYLHILVMTKNKISNNEFEDNMRAAYLAVQQSVVIFFL